MFNILKTYWDLLSPVSRRRQIVLIVLTTLSGIVELVSVGLVIPFIALAANALPFGTAQRFTKSLVDMLSHWGIPKDQHTLALGVVFLLGIAAANFYLCFYQVYAAWFVQRQRQELSARIIESLAWRPLEWLEQKNSSDLAKVILGDVERVGALTLGVTQVSAVAARLIVVSLFLVLTQPRLAFGLGIPLAVGYWAVFRFLQRPLTAAGEAVNLAHERMSRTAIELIGGAREVRVGELQNRFYQRFYRASEEAVRPGIFRSLPGHVTRAGLETVTVLVVVVLLVYFHTKDGNLANGLPLLSSYAVAGIRLLPAVQQSLHQLFEIRFYTPSLRAVAAQLEGFQSTTPRGLVETKPLGFQSSLELRGVSYAYPPEAWVLRDISLCVEKNSRVALVGATGAGKSTLVDLILALRSPQQGTIHIDNLPLTPELVASWRRTLGYVPQSIYLLDSSIAENVAFALQPEEIDHQRLEKACRAASLHDFIIGLPQGYETLVGERGVRLSGGQCQRIGIARALYHEPEIVIFDEATSSLDSVTENAVLEALESLKGDKTLIVIAHRLNTIWDFDVIFVLDEGRLIGHGSAQELLESCPKFAELARHAGQEKVQSS